MADINAINIVSVQPKSKLPKVVYGTKAPQNNAALSSMVGQGAVNAALGATVRKAIAGKANGRRVLGDPTGRYLYYMKAFVENGAGFSARECEGNVYKIDVSEAEASDYGEVWSKINTNKFPVDLDADFKSLIDTSANNIPWVRVLQAAGKFYMFYKKPGAATDVTKWGMYEYNPANDTWTQRTFPYNATQWNNFTNSGAGVTFMWPHITSNGSKLHVLTSYLYNGTSNASNSDWFREYDPATNTWTSKTSPAVGTTTINQMTATVSNATDVYWGRTANATNKLVKYNISGGTWADVDATFNTSPMFNQYNTNGYMGGAIINMDSADRIVFLKCEGGGSTLYFYDLADGDEYNVSGSNHYLSLNVEFREIVTAGSNFYLIPVRYDSSTVAFDQNWQYESFVTKAAIGSSTMKKYQVTDHAAIYKMIPLAGDVQFQKVADRASFDRMDGYASDGTDLFVFTTITARNSTIDRYDIENNTWDVGYIELPKPFMYPCMDIDANGDIYLFENFGHFIYKYDVSESKMYQLNNGHVRKRVDPDYAGGALTDTTIYLSGQYIIDFCVVPEKGAYALLGTNIPASGTILSRVEKWDLDMNYEVVMKYGTASLMGTVAGATDRPSVNSTEDSMTQGNAIAVHGMVAYDGDVYRFVGTSGVSAYRFRTDSNVFEDFFPSGIKLMANYSNGTADLDAPVCVSRFKDMIVFSGWTNPNHILATYSMTKDEMRFVQYESQSNIRGVGIGASDDANVWFIDDSYSYALPFIKKGLRKILDVATRGRILSFLNTEDVTGYLKMRLDGDDEKMETYRIEGVPQYSDLAVKFQNRIEVWADTEASAVGICYSEK